MNIYTDGQYLESNPNWHEEDSKWKAMQIQKILNRNKITSKTVCEIGCGTGAVLESLQQQASSEVIFNGYDISPQAIKRAQERENGNLHFFLGDGVKDNDYFYDVILLIDVIEHMEDYFEFLRSIKTKSAYKILHIPLDLSVQSLLRIKTILNRREEVGHLHYFTKEIALQMLQDLGYGVVDYFFTGASVDLPSRSVINALARYPRKLFFKFCPDFSVRLLGGYSLIVLVNCA